MTKLHRREFLRRLATSSVFVAIGLVGIDEAVVVLGRSQQSAPVGSTTVISQSSPGTTAQTVSQSVTQTQTTAQTILQAPAGYEYVGLASQLTSSPYLYFNHPKYGHSIAFSLGGQVKAFSATCTHAPCTVELSGSEIYCPCHRATFSTSNGAVTGGPAPRPLPEYGTLVQNGNIYVSDTLVN